jgi:hypothetical protein
MLSSLELIIKGGVMRTLQTLSVASLTTALLISTGTAEPMPRKITVLKEALLVSGNAAAAHAIVKTPDGGFVITGSILIDTSENKVWATRVTSSGEVVWNYGMPPEADRDFKGIKGTLFGALMLSDNSTLLCGSKAPDKKGGPTTGYLVHVDAAGKVLDELSLYPNGDTRFGLSQFGRCFPWGDGFALIGSATDGMHPAGWLIKLNSRGLKEWEKVNPDVGGLDAVETVEHDLVTLNPGPREFTTTLRRFDSGGQLIATRDFEGLAQTLMRSMEPTPNAYCVTAAFPNGKQTMWTLDRALHDLSPGRPIEKVGSGWSNGRAFVYPDQSLVIFGYADAGGVESIAAISFVRPNSQLQAEYKFPRGEGSTWINDAIALSSGTEFATVRWWAVSQKKRGIKLNWISVK